MRRIENGHTWVMDDEREGSFSLVVSQQRPQRDQSRQEELRYLTRASLYMQNSAPSFMNERVHPSSIYLSFEGWYQMEYTREGM